MPALKWTDADEIGFELSEKHPDHQPLSTRFTEMHKLVTELPDFTDDPNASSEGILEAIQMAWLEYSQED
jgi:FeS assembly protein IscX